MTADVWWALSRRLGEGRAAAQPGTRSSRLYRHMLVRLSDTSGAMALVPESRRGARTS